MASRDQCSHSPLFSDSNLARTLEKLEKRLTVEVRKAERTAAADDADHCKALEAQTPSAGKKQAALVVVSGFLREQPHQH